MHNNSGATHPAVARQKADGHGGGAHQKKRGDEGGLAADPIAEVAEHPAAHRPGDEGQGEGGVSGQKLGVGVALGEE